MVSGATAIELHGTLGDSVRFTIADSAAIEKGDIMVLADPRTVSGSSILTTADVSVFAGIANSEKVANDGSTSLGVWTNGIFDMIVAGGTVVLGNMVSLSGANKIQQAVLSDILSGSVIGKALETGSAAEVIAVKVGKVI